MISEAFKYDHRHHFQVYGERDGQPIAFVIRSSNPWMARIVAQDIVDHNGGGRVWVHDYFTGRPVE